MAFANFEATSTYHFQRSSKNSTKDIREPELILGFAVVWKLNEVCEWVLFKYERELHIICRPIADRGGDIQEHLKSDLVFISINFLTEKGGIERGDREDDSRPWKLLHQFHENLRIFEYLI